MDNRLSNRSLKLWCTTISDCSSITIIYLCFLNKQLRIRAIIPRLLIDPRKHWNSNHNRFCFNTFRSIYSKPKRCSPTINLNFINHNNLLTRNLIHHLSQWSCFNLVNYRCSSHSYLKPRSIRIGFHRVIRCCSSQRISPNRIIIIKMLSCCCLDTS
jgi:hypothetical protein